MRKWTDKDDAELQRLMAIRDAASAALRKDIDQALGFTADYSSVSKDRDLLIRFIASRGQALFDAFHEHFVRTPAVVPAKNALGDGSPPTWQVDAKPPFQIDNARNPDDCMTEQPPVPSPECNEYEDPSISAREFNRQ